MLSVDSVFSKYNTGLYTKTINVKTREQTYILVRCGSLQNYVPQLRDSFALQQIDGRTDRYT